MSGFDIAHEIVVDADIPNLAPVLYLPLSDVDALNEPQIEGHGLSDIANILYRDKVESPAAYLARQGRGPWKSKENIDRPYAWSDFIVGRILSKPEYMGAFVEM